jgi:cytochrome c oxidase assembly protein subunit 15
MNRALHRYCLFLSLATFCLLIAGALVTSNDAGLATLDWPLSNGQVFPKMEGNLFWEHSHRLIATTVGLLTISLVIYLYRFTLSRFLKRLTGRQTQSFVNPSEPPLWIRRLGLIALGAVIVQGLLGGLTVKLWLPLSVSAAHATFAQLFFCTIVSLAVFTSAGWNKKQVSLEEKHPLQLRYLALAAACTIFLQLILGATLRHSATWDLRLPIQLVLLHIGGALAVTLTVGSAALVTLSRHTGVSYLRRPAILVLTLLIVQLNLGVASYFTRIASVDDPQPLNPMIGITVAHVACGALVFAVTIVLTLRSFKTLRRNREAVDVKRNGQLWPVLGDRG